jgi:hypothetical protein
MKQRRFRMIVMKRKQTSRVGRRCKDFEPSCMVCSCYHFYDLYKRYPKDWDEAQAHLKALEDLAEAGAIKSTMEPKP